MRWLIALLGALNVATLAWQFDAFAHWGWAPNTAREPERLLNQIRPTAIQTETPAAAAKRMAVEAATPATPPTPAETPAETPADSAAKPAPTASVLAPAANDAPVVSKRAASPPSNP